MFEFPGSTRSRVAAKSGMRGPLVPPARQAVESEALAEAVALVRTILAEAGVTQSQLAEALSIHRSSVGHRHGGRYDLSVATLAGMLHELGYMLVLEARPVSAHHGDDHLKCAHEHVRDQAPSDSEPFAEEPADPSSPTVSTADDLDGSALTPHFEPQRARNWPM